MSQGGDTHFKIQPTNAPASEEMALKGAIIIPWLAVFPPNRNLLLLSQQKRALLCVFSTRASG